MVASSPRSGPATQEAEVGVEARGGGIVIAGGDMDVAADAVGIAAHDEAHLGVDLVADEAIDDVDAGFLKLARPLDIIGFVKAGAKLDDGGYLLAVLDGLHEGADDARIAAGAVKGLLDSEDLGVLARPAPRRLHDAVETFVGVMEQDVASSRTAAKISG